MLKNWDSVVSLSEIKTMASLKILNSLSISRCWVGHTKSSHMLALALLGILSIPHVCPIGFHRVYRDRLSTFILALLQIWLQKYDIVKIVLTVNSQCLLGSPRTAVLNSLTSVKSRVYFEFNFQTTEFK